MTNELSKSPPSTTDDVATDRPSNGHKFEYECPVDHAGHTVSMAGWRCSSSEVNPPLVLVHDVGESMQFYRKCAKYICESGFSCYGYNQRGQGRTADNLDHIQGFDDLVTDLIQVCAWVKHLHHGVPPIVVGQGYGCLVTCEFLRRQSSLVGGAVLCAPTVELARKPGSIKKGFIKFLSDIAPDMTLSKLFLPRFSNPRFLLEQRAQVTRGGEGGARWQQPRLTSNFARELLDAMTRFPDTFAKIAVPILLIRPGDDEVARFETIMGLILQHPSPQLIKVSTFDGMHHNPLSESQETMEHVTNEVIKWIGQRYSSEVAR